MKSVPTILIADDEQTICKLLHSEFETSGYAVKTVLNGQAALNELSRNRYDAVVLDVNMPQATGLQVLSTIRRSYPGTIVVMMTAYGSIDGAVTAMKMQADDYITKPFSPEELVGKINDLLTVKSRMSQLDRGVTSDTSTLVGESPNLQEIRRTIDKVKDLDVTVLITGESGTGKGVVAKYLHMASNRQSLPFVHVDCASLPHNLIESELFGHEKGAFTSAAAQRKGKFEQAGRGTIFLDEIGTMPLELQAKFLIVLQERSFERLGGDRKIPMEARVIAATNEDLEQSVNAGSFRRDLFFRLSIVNMECLPLRQRREDIPVLARHFLEKHTQKTGIQIDQVDDEVWQALSNYDWPGNTRELENTIESAIILCDGHRISLENLPRKITTGSGFKTQSAVRPAGPTLSLESQEIMTILAALEKHNGHREKTAQELGISRRALQYKLAKYHLNK